MVNGILLYLPGFLDGVSTSRWWVGLSFTSSFHYPRPNLREGTSACDESPGGDAHCLNYARKSERCHKMGWTYEETPAYDVRGIRNFLSLPREWA
jgi:hypothetical protein